MPFGAILIVILLGIAIFAATCIARYNKCEDIADSPFKCPNCDEEFKVSWARIMFTPNVSLVFNKRMRLKCPHCKMTDMCKWQSEFDL